MKRFEYHIYKHSVVFGWLGSNAEAVDPDDMDGELNALGRQGWELVSSCSSDSTRGNSRQPVCIFIFIYKRELTS